MEKRLKYNFWKHLRSEGFDIDYEPILKRVKKDFRQQKIKYNRNEVKEKIWKIIFQNRYEVKCNMGIE